MIPGLEDSEYYPFSFLGITKSQMGLHGPQILNFIAFFSQEWTGELGSLGLLGQGVTSQKDAGRCLENHIALLKILEDFLKHA